MSEDPSRDVSIVIRQTLQVFREIDDIDYDQEVIALVRKIKLVDEEESADVDYATNKLQQLASGADLNAFTVNGLQTLCEEMGMNTIVDSRAWEEKDELIKVLSTRKHDVCEHIVTLLARQISPLTRDWVEKEEVTPVSAWSTLWNSMPIFGKASQTGKSVKSLENQQKFDDGNGDGAQSITYPHIEVNKHDETASMMERRPENGGQHHIGIRQQHGQATSAQSLLPREPDKDEGLINVSGGITGFARDASISQIHTNSSLFHRTERNKHFGANHHVDDDTPSRYFQNLRSSNTKTPNMRTGLIDTATKQLHEESNRHDTQRRSEAISISGRSAASSAVKIVEEGHSATGSVLRENGKTDREPQYAERKQFRDAMEEGLTSKAQEHVMLASTENEDISLIEHTLTALKDTSEKPPTDHAPSSQVTNGPQTPAHTTLTESHNQLASTHGAPSTTTNRDDEKLPTCTVTYPNVPISEPRPIRGKALSQTGLDRPTPPPSGPIPTLFPLPPIYATKGISRTPIVSHATPLTSSYRPDVDRHPEVERLSVHPRPDNLMLYDYFDWRALSTMIKELYRDEVTRLSDDDNLQNSVKARTKAHVDMFKSYVRALDDTMQENLGAGSAEI